MAKQHNSFRNSLSLHLRAARDVNRYCHGLLPSVVLSSVFKAVQPYAAVFFSARVLEELAGQRRPEMLLRWVLLTVFVTAVLSLANHLLSRWRDAKHSHFSMRMDNILNDKFFSMDFGDLDKQENQDKYIQIRQSQNWAGWGLGYIPRYCQWFTEGCAGILSATLLTVTLFTTPVPAGSLAMLNSPLFLPVMLAVMVGITALASALGNKANAAWSDMGEEARLGNRLFSHFLFASNDKRSAMDRRIYDQMPLIRHYMYKIKVFGRNTPMAAIGLGQMGICLGLSQGLSAVFTGVVYVFVCLKAWAGAFSVGMVTQYVGAVTALSRNVQILAELVGHMKSNTPYLKTVYEFLDIPNTMTHGSEAVDVRSPLVEFRDVSFRYPGSDTWALRHVDITFQGDKCLAVVGENGSGKTTFIKLLCRLYDPTEGQILLNGVDIRFFDYRQYMALFSVVFQDFQLISQSLGSNVAGSGRFDRARAEQCLRAAGFGDRLDSLPKGLDTLLYKDFGEDGVNISGGEAQKIAIARALYRDAPVLVLDEPTAALDPIAEAEVYEKFHDITAGKTAIYISHRLSSCKFCDEILVFRGGSVAEQGTHEALLGKEKGHYKTLWNAQAQYYQER